VHDRLVECAGRLQAESDKLGKLIRDNKIVVE